MVDAITFRHVAAVRVTSLIQVLKRVAQRLWCIQVHNCRRFRSVNKIRLFVELSLSYGFLEDLMFFFFLRTVNGFESLRI